jgi:hypothetical protein
MNQQNKDIPAYPIKFNDQFGQLIVLGGMSKLELTALELLKATYQGKNFEDFSTEDEVFSIKCAFEMAEIFCNYIENKAQKESKIIS